jgi:hypothetical protein
MRDRSCAVWLDGVLQADNGVPLRNDGVDHDVRVLLPAIARRVDAS